MRVSLCLEMIFRDLPFMRRIEAACNAGYDTVEFWGWEDKPWREIGVQAAARQMSIAAFSANRRHGLCLPAERDALLAEVRASLEKAQVLDCGHLMLLASPLLQDGSADFSRQGSTENELDRQALDSLHALAALAAQHGVVLELEPLNTRLDHPGYPLDNSRRAFQWISEVNSPWIRVLYDVYHMYTMGEDVLRCVEQNLPWIGYLHFADAPGRHEPGSGEIPYTELCSLLRRKGYDGVVGLEFSPSGGDDAAASAALNCLGRG
jgi:hydroxypyruvate isomerase